jgi:hypothetical protein
LGEAEADMGIALGDVNGDHMTDVFVTHRANETHTLWLQGPPGIYIDKTPSSRITRTSWRGTGFGTTLADLDNDGDLDLVMVNGRVLRYSGELPVTPPDVEELWRGYAQRDQLLLNDGTGKYEDVSEQNPDLCRDARVSRGLACGDLNNDGKMDCVVTTIAGPARVFRNVSSSAGHWLLVRAVDPALQRDAHGAAVELRFGGRSLSRDINPGYSYLASNDPRAHFGLGSTASYDGIVVKWPDGSIEEFPGGTADQIVTLHRGQGTISPSFTQDRVDTGRD